MLSVTRAVQMSSGSMSADKRLEPFYRHRFGERESKILGFFRVCVSHSIISTPEYLELFRSCFIKVSSIGGPLDYLNRPMGQSSHSNDPYTIKGHPHQSTIILNIHSFYHKLFSIITPPSTGLIDVPILSNF